MNTAVIERDAVKLTFSAPWDAAGHELFIQAKKLPEARYEFNRIRDIYTVTAPARFAPLVGLTPPVVTKAATELVAHLFPVQKWIVEMALEAKRFAIWADCGFGKTPMGYGLNFPFVDEMIFSGFNDSWEMFYQAVRRGHRYGRQNRLHVNVPFIPELEGHQWANLGRKKAQWEADIAQQEQNYVEALQS